MNWQSCPGWAFVSTLARGSVCLSTHRSRSERVIEAPVFGSGLCTCRHAKRAKGSGESDEGKRSIGSRGQQGQGIGSGTPAKRSHGRGGHGRQAERKKETQDRDRRRGVGCE